MFKNKLITIFHSLVFLFALNLSASYEAKQAGMSQERLDKIAPTLSKYIAQKEIPGLITAVLRKGRIVHFETQGYADVENKIPLQEDSLFRIYSMTKPVTGVALMILLEDGKIRLDDPVQKFIPEFKKTKVFKGMDDSRMLTESLARPITIRDLATHTSGLSYAINRPNPVSNLYREKRIFPYYYPSQEGDLEGAKSYQDICSFAESVASLPLRHQPGLQWTYSIGMDILGCVIERASGKTFDVFLKERLFEPLKMKDTAFYIPEDKKSRHTNLYINAPLVKMMVPEMASMIKDDQLMALLVDRRVCPYLKKPTVFDGGSGLISSTADYLKFAQMLLNNGKVGQVRILSRKSVELLSSDLLSQDTKNSNGSGRWKGRGFGITVGVTNDPGLSGEYGSSGKYYWGGAAATVFWIDPKEELAAVAMTQLLGSRLPLREDFEALVYAAIDD